jgi:hypothetical protein
MNQTKEQLEHRRNEILAQLNRVNADERIELDTDLEEQAIQIEQNEVAISREENLQKELIEIEEKLLEFEDEV